MTVTPSDPKPITATAPAQEPSIGQLASTASEHLSTIIRGEIALAKAEFSVSLKRAGLAIGMFGAAAVLLVFSLTFGFIALAEGLVALGIWRWAAFLIVFGFFVLIAALLVIIGVRLIKRAKPTGRTVETAKDTAAYLRHPAKTTAG